MFSVAYGLGLTAALVACVWFGFVRPHLIDSGFWLKDHSLRGSRANYYQAPRNHCSHDALATQTDHHSDLCDWPILPPALMAGSKRLVSEEELRHTRQQIPAVADAAALDPIKS
jgi:hypothetical protein